MSLHGLHLRLLLTEIHFFMRPCFKYRQVPYNLRRGPVRFTPPRRSSIYSTNSVHFHGSLIWNKLPNLVKSTRSIPEFKNILKKIGNIDCGCMMSRKLHTLSQFPRKSRSFVLLDHLDTSHLAVCCSQLTGCYMIFKNTDNVVHLVY